MADRGAGVRLLELAIDSLATYRLVKLVKALAGGPWQLAVQALALSTITGMLADREPTDD